MAKRKIRKEGQFVLSRDKNRKWLLEQDNYAVHNYSRNGFRLRKDIAQYVDYQWDIDEANNSSLYIYLDSSI